jgi:hypothetical protein
MITIAAIATIAFILADIGHEVVGHWIGFALAGGHGGVFTTTRLIETQRLGDAGGVLFDLGGPFGNLLFAAMSWMLYRRARGAHFRLLFGLTMAFSLFWAFAYLIFSGAKAGGDWWAAVQFLPYPWLWRIVFIASGIWLYRESLRAVGTLMPCSRETAVVCYIAGGVIATLGAALDPRGITVGLHDGALVGFGSTVGLLFLPRSAEQSIRRSIPWIAAAAASAAFFIGALGPGIRFSF